MRASDRNIFSFERQNTRIREEVRAARQNCEVSWDVLLVNPWVSHFHHKSTRFAIWCLTWVHFNLRWRGITELWVLFSLLETLLMFSLHFLYVRTALVIRPRLLKRNERPYQQFFLFSWCMLFSRCVYEINDKYEEGEFVLSSLWCVLTPQLKQGET